MEKIKYNHKLVILAGASGVGKSSIEQMLWNLSLRKTISYTTRKPRSNEIDGVDYNFISKEQFKDMIKSGDMLEYTERYDNFYGTGKNSINLNKHDYVIVVDPNGYESLKNHFGENNVILIYIYIDDYERLIRLLKRDKNVSSSIKRYYEDNKTFADIANKALFKIPNIDIKTSALNIKNLILKQINVKEGEV